MKKIISYSLLVLVLFAFNYKAVSYLLSSSSDSTMVVVDFDCEEENTESEKSQEKTEKKDLSEYLFDIKSHSLIVYYQLGLKNPLELMFIPSGYVKSVYMPPEHI